MYESFKKPVGILRAVFIFPDESVALGVGLIPALGFTDEEGWVPGDWVVSGFNDRLAEEGLELSIVEGVVGVTQLANKNKDNNWILKMFFYSCDFLNLYNLYNMRQKLII